MSPPAERDEGQEPRSIGIDRQIDKLESRRASKEDRRASGDLTGQKARGVTEKVLTRTTSGAIYALVTLVCLFIGPITTTLLVAGMAWLCCSEFFRICRMGGRMPNESIGLAAALLYPLAAYAKGQAALVIVTFLLLITCACWYVLSIWANDALAYFVGSKIGAHKLAPRISPHKSWEGFYGGLVASVVVWLAMGALGVEGLTPVPCVLMGLIVGMAGVIGDLFESRIKRGVGVKDSGNLMPGHGGLLDRSDSLLFGCMAAYFLLLVGGIL